MFSKLNESGSLNKTDKTTQAQTQHLKSYNNFFHNLSIMYRMKIFLRISNYDDKK